MNEDRLKEVLEKFKNGGTNHGDVLDEEIERCRNMGWITQIGSVDDGKIKSWLLTPAGEAKLRELCCGDE